MKRIFKMFPVSGGLLAKGAKLFGAVLSILPLTACAVEKPVYMQYADTAMGTVMQMNSYATQEKYADAFFDRAMDELNVMERELLSWRVETSEVFGVNENAGTQGGIMLSAELAEILTSSLDVWEKSDGAFDITLGAVARLWNIDSFASGISPEESFIPPTQEALALALEKCGSGQLRLVDVNVVETSANETYTAKEETAVKAYIPHGMQIDLGAVGKGIALNKIHTLLKEQEEITGAVFSAGGSVLVYGSKPDGGNWRVGIVNPLDTSASIGALVLDASGWYVTTSGDYERYVEVGGVRYHHILDPATGYPAQSDVRGVTILTKDGLLGDALSTACFVLGAEEGLALVEKYDAEALFVLADGEVVLSDGLMEISEGVFSVIERGSAEVE